MAKTFKILSLLLSYPTADLKAAASDLVAVLNQEALIPTAERTAVCALLERIARDDLFDLQERYVLLFDRTRSLSLHLFEHVHGESRDRGQAMVDLRNQYEAKGMVTETTELPDYLPLFLEFLSVLPLAEAREYLEQPAHILQALGERLARRESDYGCVFHALLAIAGVKPAQEAVEVLMQEPDPDPMDLKALDAVWEEAAVKFGPDENACKDGLVSRIRAARRPAPGMSA